MGKTLDLGRRLELEPMDTHCQNASLALYGQDVAGVTNFLVHTYSKIEDATQRVAFMNQALIVMVGLEESDDSPEIPGAESPGAPSLGDWLQFGCKTMHKRALKRAFLDLCKLETGSPLAPKPLTVFDKKANGNLSALNRGSGVYEIQPEDGTEQSTKRASAVARGFAKLCEIEIVDGTTNQVAFPCKANHDALIGMLMFRAQNVRAAMQEDEMAASRGVLSSPSQQE